MVIDNTKEIINGNNCHFDEDGNCICVGSPIVFDLDGDGIALSDYADGVMFQLKPGVLARWAWPVSGSDDAWLALPGDNGVVDNGAELFGDSTLQGVSGELNGFLALLVHDHADHGGNSDAAIDAQDEVFARLRLWRDINRDGVSQSAELIDLPRAGVSRIGLEYEASAVVDEHGNQFRYHSQIVADAPVSPVVYDVFLLSDQPQVTPTQTGGGGAATQTMWDRDCTATCWSVKNTVTSAGLPPYTPCFNGQGVLDRDRMLITHRLHTTSPANDGVDWAEASYAECSNRAAFPEILTGAGCRATVERPISYAVCSFTPILPPPPPPTGGCR